MALSIALITGCSTIKSWFPDKERDYQFTSEIPELIIPDDLKAKASAPLSSPRTTAAVASQPEPVATKPAPVDAAKPAPAKSVVKNKDEAKPVSTTVPSTTTASSLQIDQSQNQAVRIVARALTRQKIEIVERNIEKGYFYVKFDPNAVKATDESWLDEMNFLFGDDPSQEQEYRVSLQEIAAQTTEVTVEDDSGKLLSNAPANALLKLITEGINQDTSPIQPENQPAAQ